MSRHVPELESILQQMIDEHDRLLKHFQVQHEAMKAFDLKAMDVAVNLQEASRLRVATLETKRRTLVAQLARAHGLTENMTIADIAKLYPQRGQALIKLRDTLKEAISQIATRTHIAGKLAGAVLGHLNTVVRLLAGAVDRAGLYTKHGVPQVSARIGVMEAVG